MGWSCLQMPVVTDALVEYIKVDLIPKHPVACHELGTFVYPQLNLEGLPSLPLSTNLSATRRVQSTAWQARCATEA